MGSQEPEKPPLGEHLFWARHWGMRQREHRSGQKKAHCPMGAALYRVPTNTQTADLEPCLGVKNQAVTGFKSACVRCQRILKDLRPREQLR